MKKKKLLTGKRADVVVVIDSPTLYKVVECVVYIIMLPSWICVWLNKKKNYNKNKIKKKRKQSMKRQEWVL